MSQVMSVRDFRDVNAIFNECKRRNEPLFLQKEGYDDLVVMSRNTYKAFIANMEIEASIEAYELEKEMGIEPLDAREVLSELRRKYIG